MASLESLPQSPDVAFTHHVVAESLSAVLAGFSGAMTPDVTLDELGLTSVQAIEVLLEIEERSGHEIPPGILPEKVIKFSTVGELTDRLNAAA